VREADAAVELAGQIWKQMAPAPRVSASASSLTRMLDDIWATARELAASPDYGPIYKMYNRVTEANPISRDYVEFLQELVGIAANRPEAAVSNTQSFGGGGNALRGLAEMRGTLPENMRRQIDSTFFRFQRANWRPDKVAERVYVNARADTAPTLMGRIIHEIVDQPKQYPGVEIAKISGPAVVGSRAENIVIYTQGGETTQRVVKKVLELHRDHPKWFNNSVPMMTKPVASGVAIGAEPTKFAGRESFGSIRARAIFEALVATVSAGGEEAAFRQAVTANLRKYGVDPLHPHRNLPEDA
jgi:hypothetical protein